jgi:hypothetical protein
LASDANEVTLFIDLQHRPYKDIAQIKPEDISSVEIYNIMPMASHWFGEKAKNGAIFIRTKNYPFSVSEKVQVGFCIDENKYVQLSRKPGMERKGIS